MHGNSRHGSHARGRAAADGAGGRGASRPAPGKTPGSAAAGAAPDPGGLVRLLEPVVRAMNMDLEGLKVTTTGRRRLLRVVVDADGGVSLDDIALASRELSARLDGAGEMGELPYTLEVSSPGVDRPLTQPRHWRRAIGRLVAAQLTASANDHDGNGAGSVLGRVVGTSEHGVSLDCDGVTRDFDYAELGPGRVQVEFGTFDDGGREDAGAPGEGEENLGGH